jgi:hypothetical protein
MPRITGPNIFLDTAFGPAMLVNHGCVLDKRTNSGKAKVEHFTFVSLKSVTALDQNRQNLLRRGQRKLLPYEAMYLGEVSGVGESYVSFSDPYHLPASYFEVSMADFSEEFPDEDPFRLVASKFDNRVARLSSQQLSLFAQKWTAYWTRTLPVEEEPGSAVVVAEQQQGQEGGLPRQGT